MNILTLSSKKSPDPTAVGAFPPSLGYGATSRSYVANWLLEYRETIWDEKIEADAYAGKLDPLIKRAKAGYRAGKATPFP